MEMNYSLIAERLKLRDDDIKRGFKRGIIGRIEYKGIPMITFRKKIKHVERGTTLFLNEDLDYVAGYPKIRRALVLNPTIKNYFIDKVVVEEKLDGYNVRIAKINDDVVAITRGGYICPFTTKKAIQILNTKFFEDHPNLMLCGEMIGLNNPYVPHYYEEVDRGWENLGFYIFDIRDRETNEPLSIKEKIKTCKKYNLPYVEPLGEFDKEDAHEYIKEIIDKLNAENREGVVLKDPDMAVNPIKYTTHKTQCGDLRVAFTFFYDLGVDFMFSRVVREGYQAYEFNEDDDTLKKRALDIGESILYPMVDTIKKIHNGERVTEDFEIVVDNEEDLKEFLEYSKKLHMQIIVKNMEKIKVDDEYKIKVKIGKIYSTTNDKVLSHLNGGLW
ncbi:RNA ligase [Methanotorris formicicus]|uniref:ATP dependent DNA ligase n=1 Tax=Methanotorris formicicus Mc-S-70 TaxID=647171 RepID=H1KYS0_9EURY|nr:RNA ligase [Methanotorris formicicus]EHP86817.1 ATP dependent DNA ligase [Methanotorris formicicus Mc-S-70]